MRALWAPGTKAYAGEPGRPARDDGYPRPAGRIPVIVGGNGERRTLPIAARLGDGCNLPSRLRDARPQAGRAAAHLDAVGRAPDDLEVTVLDLPVVGRDRDDVWARVERLRGRTDAAAYAKKHTRARSPEQRDRYAGLADRGVRTVFVSHARPRRSRGRARPGAA